MEEAVYVITHSKPPDPMNVGDKKLRVWGRTLAGRLVQVIYTQISSGRISYDELEFDDIINFESDPGPYGYVIHARELTNDEKRSFHRRGP
jgi:hypothetical protein